MNSIHRGTCSLDFLEVCTAFQSSTRLRREQYVCSIDFLVRPQVAAERQKICSPWREPWGRNTRAKPAPAGAKPMLIVIRVSPLCGLSRGPQSAVGYRSYAAPRLVLRPFADSPFKSRTLTPCRTPPATVGKLLPFPRARFRNLLKCRS